jgi:hypothetical protein
MKRVAVLTIGLLLALSVSATTLRKATPAERQQTGSGSRLPDRQLAIRVNITTGGGLFGPTRDRFRVSEQIPVTITMTNTSNQPEYTCVSEPLYQDLPRLTNGGRLVPYMKWQSYELATAEKNGRCLDGSDPDMVLLRPNEPTVVDWFVLADYGDLDADAWYHPLSPGSYELSIQRRLGCCDGAMVDSNKINFEVVP